MSANYSTFNQDKSDIYRIRPYEESINTKYSSDGGNFNILFDNDNENGIELKDIKGSFSTKKDEKGKDIATKNDLWEYDSSNKNFKNLESNKFVSSDAAGNVVSATDNYIPSLSIVDSSGENSAYEISFIANNGETMYLCNKIDNDKNYSVAWRSSSEKNSDGWNAEWGFERFIKMTSIPGNEPDYFGEAMYDSSDSSFAMPEEWESGVKKLYDLAFAPEDVNTLNGFIYYNLYGARYNATVSKYAGCIHPGVDIQYYTGSQSNPNFDVPVHAPFSGNIVAYNPDYGVVTMQVPDTDVYYTFMHLDFEDADQEILEFIENVSKNPEIKDAEGNRIWIEQGTVLGKQSYTGLNSTSKWDKHLHVELIRGANLDDILEAITTENGQRIYSSDLTSIYNYGSVTLGKSILPYEWFNKLRSKEGRYIYDSGLLSVIRYEYMSYEEIRDELYTIVLNIQERFEKYSNSTLSTYEKLVKAINAEKEYYTYSNVISEKLNYFTSEAFLQVIEQVIEDKNKNWEDMSEEELLQMLLEKIYEEIDLVE